MYNQMPGKKRGRDTDNPTNTFVPVSSVNTAGRMTMGFPPSAVASMNNNNNNNNGDANNNSGGGTAQPWTMDLPTTVVPAGATTSARTAPGGFSFLAPPASSRVGSARGTGPTTTNNNSTAAAAATNTNSNNTANNKNSSQSKEDALRSLGLLPPAPKLKAKACDPLAGLTLGGVPVTQEKLATLSPMDLDEHALMRHGEPLPISELAALLGLEDLVDDDWGDDDDMDLYAREA